jgi:hypothetical protein
MAKYIDGSHNMLYELSRAKWMADLKKSGKADITGYQEAREDGQREALKDFCKQADRAVYHPLGTGTPISWKKDVFGQVRIQGKYVRGFVYVHPSALAMGLSATKNPEREFTYVGLLHRSSGKKVLRINVHPTAGGTKPETQTDDSVALSKYKDWGVGQYWLDVLSFTAGQMSLQDPGRTTMASLWDIVTIGGDYNATLEQDDRWYYPDTMLHSLFVEDSVRKGIDHLQHAYGSDVRAGRRWSEPANSDHPIIFIERTIVDVENFPREKV